MAKIWPQLSTHTAQHSAVGVAHIFQWAFSDLLTTNCIAGVRPGMVLPFLLPPPPHTLHCRQRQLVPNWLIRCLLDQMLNKTEVTHRLQIWKTALTRHHMRRPIYTAKSPRNMNPCNKGTFLHGKTSLPGSNTISGVSFHTMGSPSLQMTETKRRAILCVIALCLFLPWLFFLLSLSLHPPEYSESRLFDVNINKST